MSRTVTNQALKRRCKKLASQSRKEAGRDESPHSAVRCPGQPRGFILSPLFYLACSAVDSFILSRNSAANITHFLQINSLWFCSLCMRCPSSVFKSHDSNSLQERLPNSFVNASTNSFVFASTTALRSGSFGAVNPYRRPMTMKAPVTAPQVSCIFPIPAPKTDASRNARSALR